MERFVIIFQMHTELVDSSEINRRSRKICEEIEKICNSGASLTQYGMHRDPVQTLLLRRGSNSDFLITPIIESAAIQAEKSAAGAGELFLKMFSRFFPVEVMREKSGLFPDPEWEKIADKVQKFSIPGRKSDLVRIFQDSGQCHRDVLAEVFQKIKAGDKILVRKTASSKTQIQREVGYTFEGLNIDPRFLSRGHWSRRGVKVILIDGVIENITEIHALLEDLSSKKTPCVIFCIDSLPDVSETLVKNFLMGNLDVILVKIPVDEFHINTSVDLGIILGLEPISAQLGETISLGVKRQKNTADRIVISKNQVNIENVSTRESVNSHARELRKRISDNIELSLILEPRLKSLNSSAIRVDVGIEDQKKDPNIVEKLDRTFRSLPKILRMGFIEKNDFQEFSSDKICLLFEKDNVASAEMVYQAVKVFLSTRQAIQSAEVGIRSV